MRNEENVGVKTKKKRKWREKASSMMIMRNDFDLLVMGSKYRVLIRNTINSKLPVERSWVLQRIDWSKG